MKFAPQGTADVDAIPDAAEVRARVAHKSCKKADRGNTGNACGRTQSDNRSKGGAQNWRTARNGPARFNLEVQVHAVTRDNWSTGREQPLAFDNLASRPPPAIDETSPWRHAASADSSCAIKPAVLISSAARREKCILVDRWSRGRRSGARAPPQTSTQCVNRGIRRIIAYRSFTAP